MVEPGARGKTRACNLVPQRPQAASDDPFGCSAMAAHLARVISNVPVLNKIHYPTVIQIRHKRREPVRKPIWLPQAPSKLFKIPKKPELSEEEVEMLQQLEFKYQVAFSSLANQCRQQFFLPTLSSSKESIESQLEKKRNEEFKILISENNEENARVAADREVRRAKELAEWQAYLKQRQLEEAAKNEKLHEKAQKDIETELKRCETFITREKLVEAIEEALLHPVHYDFAVDRGGKVYSDGKIHPNAFTPSAVPETSSHRDSTMQELPSNLRLKAHKLY